MNALSFLPAALRRRARGVAHIELALLFTTMAFLLPLILSMGRIFYVYIVLKQSTATVAHYLATLPQAEWNSTAVMNQAMTNKMFQLGEQGLRDAGIAPAIPLHAAGYLCNGDRFCGGERQETVTASLAVKVPLDYTITVELGLPQLLTIQTSVTVPYTR